jgi:hypothetical protein
VPMTVVSGMVQGLKTCLPTSSPESLTRTEAVLGFPISVLLSIRLCTGLRWLHRRASSEREACPRHGAESSGPITRVPTG